MSVTLKWRKGSRHSVPIEIVAAELASIEAADGHIKPDAVVEAARPKNAPLHPEFTWDNTKAAEAWRRREAGKLISHVVVVDEKTGRERAPVYVSIVDEDDERGYESIGRVMASDEKQGRMLEEAMRSLAGWRRRYRHLQELGPIHALVDEALDEMSDLAG